MYTALTSRLASAADAAMLDDELTLWCEYDARLTSPAANSKVDVKRGYVCVHDKCELPPLTLPVKHR
jgi:hypothetical protein